MFDDIINNLKEFNVNAWGHVAEAINENSEEITNINTVRIFEKGTDAEDKKIKNKNTNYADYSPGYKAKKKRLGLYNGHVNLFLSGNYLGSYDTKADSKEVDVFVDPSNADLDAILKDMYGVDIQGLTDDEWSQVVEEFILPKIINELTKVFV